MSRPPPRQALNYHTVGRRLLHGLCYLCLSRQPEGLFYRVRLDAKKLNSLTANCKYRRRFFSGGLRSSMIRFRLIKKSFFVFRLPPAPGPFPRLIRNHYRPQTILYVRTCLQFQLVLE